MSYSKTRFRLEKIIAACENITSMFVDLTIKHNESSFDNKKATAFAKSFAKKCKDSKKTVVPDPKKISGYKGIEQELPQYLTRFKHNYDVTCQLILFVSVFHNFLNNMMSTSIVFKIEVNPQIIGMTLDAITSYSKLMVAVSQESDVFLYCYLVIAAKENTASNKPSQKEKLHIVQFLNETSEIILRSQNLFYNFKNQVIIALTDLIPIYQKWIDPILLSATNVFVPEHFDKDPAKFQMTVDELSMFSRINEWIIFVILMNIQVLKSPNLFTLFKSVTENNYYFVVAYLAKAKITNIFQATSEYANNLKISGFKAIIKDEGEVARAKAVEKSLARIVIWGENINKFADFLDEKPFYRAKYFEAALAALGVLKAEISILLTNLEGEPDPAVEMKLTEAIHVHVRLKESMKVYAPLVQEHFTNIVCKDGVAKLTEQLEQMKAMGLKQFNIMQKKTETLVEIFQSGNLKEKYEDIETNIKNLLSFWWALMNERMQNEMLDGDKGAVLSKSRNAAIPMGMMRLRRLLDFVFFAEKAVDQAGDANDCILTGSALAIFMVMIKNNSDPKCISIIYLFSSDLEFPPHIAEIKNNHVIHLITRSVSIAVAEILVYVAKLATLEFNQNLRQSPEEFEKENSLAKQIQFKIYYYLQAVCVNPVIKINTLKIYPQKVIKDKLVYLFVNMFKTFPRQYPNDEKDLSYKSPKLAYSKLILLNRIYLCLSKFGNYNLQDTLKFGYQYQCANNDEDGFTRVYLKGFFDVLSRPDTLFSEARKQFISSETRSQSEMVGDDGIRHFVAIVGLQGVKVVGNVIFGRLNTLIGLFINQIVEFQKIHGEGSTNSKTGRKSLKKLENAVATAIDIGKMAMFSKKIVRMSNENFEEKLGFLSDSIDFVASKAGRERADDAQFFGPATDEEFALKKAVRAVEGKGVFERVAEALPFFFETDLFAKAQKIAEEGSYAGNVLLALYAVVRMEELHPDGEELVKKVFAKAVSKILEISSGTPEKGEPFTNFDIYDFVLYIKKCSTFITNVEFERLFPRVLLMC